MYFSHICLFGGSMQGEGSLLEVEPQVLIKIKNIYKPVLRAYRKLTVLVQGLRCKLIDFFFLSWHLNHDNIVKQNSGMMTSYSTALLISCQQSFYLHITALAASITIWDLEVIVEVHLQVFAFMRNDGPHASAVHRKVLRPMRRLDHTAIWMKDSTTSWKNEQCVGEMFKYFMLVLSENLALNSHLLLRLWDWESRSPSTHSYPSFD